MKSIIKTLVNLTFLAVFIFTITSCCFNKLPHYPKGGPFYYQSSISNYNPFRPVMQISYEEAMSLDRDKNGTGCVRVYFNDQRQPIIIEQLHGGKVDYKAELSYENGELSKSIVTTTVSGKTKVKTTDY